MSDLRNKLIKTRRDWLKVALGASIYGMTRAQAAQKRMILSLATFMDPTITDFPIGVKRPLFEGWLKFLQDKSEVSDVAQPYYCKSVEDFLNRLKQTRGAAWHAFPMYAHDFVQLREACQLEPLLVPEWPTGPELRYALYVRNDSGITKLDQLRGKVISVETGGRGGLAALFIGNALHRENLDIAGFATFNEVATPLMATMPTFFGRGNGSSTSADACIVTEIGFDEVAKLNPRISAEMRKILVSKPMLTHVIACQQILPAEQQRKLRDLALVTGARFYMHRGGTSFRMVKFEPRFAANLTEEMEYKDRNFREARPSESTMSEFRGLRLINPAKPRNASSMISEGLINPPSGKP